MTDLRPSLVPLETKEPWVKDLMGLSLRNVELSAVAKDKVQAKQFGEMSLLIWDYRPDCFIF